MAVVLTSIQICDPLFFGFEYSACQLGTVMVLKPFQKPGNVLLEVDGSNRKVWYTLVPVRPARKWCPARSFMLRSDIREKPNNVGMKRTPGMGVVWVSPSHNNRNPCGM